MRAKEFILETSKVGKISKRNSQASRGINKFRDANLADRAYELNRLMMAAACTDGTFVPEVDAESWSGRYNTAHPYSKEEQAMMNMAYRAIGSEHHDLNKGNNRSMELDSTNKHSPVAAPKFKFK